MQNGAVRQTDAELSRTASTRPRAVVALSGTARRREDNDSLMSQWDQLVDESNLVETKVTHSYYFMKS